MKACRYACVFALGAAIVEACGGDLPKAVTAPVASSVAPGATVPPRATEVDAAVDPDGVDVQFVQGPTTIAAPPCSRVFLAVAQGSVSTLDRVLATGDVMIVKYPDRMSARVDGLALRVIQPFHCQLFDKPGAEVAVRRAGEAAALTWARGAMHAHLDVGTDVSPDLYLGRLSGTAGVAAHKHDGSVEILAAVEASGTFVLDGKTQRLGPRQIVIVPKDTTHAWSPDPGSNLVAWQMYLPPGPEQRFVALDAAERDAGRDAAPPGAAPPGAAPPRAAPARSSSRTRPSTCPVEAWDPYDLICRAKTSK